MVDLVHNFGAQKRKRGASFKRVTDATLEVVGEADQHPTEEGSDGKATVIMDSLEMGFHGQSASETMRRLGRAFPWSKLLAGKIRLCLPGPGAVGRCFPSDAVEFLHSSIGSGSPYGGSIGF